MVPSSPFSAAEFRERMRDSFLRDNAHSAILTVPRHGVIYRAGDPVEMVYFVEYGRVKLETVTREGKACVLSLHPAGDLFGENAAADAAYREETATAMEHSQLRRIGRAEFLARLRQDGLLEMYIHYLAAHVADQHQRIMTLVTMNGEQRLGKTLLALSGTQTRSGSWDTARGIRISHEDLASLVGTTRPRVTTFLRKFLRLKLIAIGERKGLIVNRHQLAAWLTHRT